MQSNYENIIAIVIELCVLQLVCCFNQGFHIVAK